MESKYKPGDTVALKKKYDPNCDSHSYPCGFIKQMLETPQKTAVIKIVLRLENPYSRTKKMYVEPYNYILEDIAYTWHASMFENYSEEL